jgi:hypothetical protein
MGMREVASALDLSYGYVRRLRARGDLVPDLTVDGKPLWLPATVDRLRKERDATEEGDTAARADSN